MSLTAVGGEVQGRYPAGCQALQGTDSAKEQHPQYPSGTMLYSAIPVQSHMSDELKQNFINVLANYPGSTHDARIQRESKLLQEYDNSETRPFEAFILGDSAYPTREWLFPPFKNHRTISKKDVPDDKKSCIPNTCPKPRPTKMTSWVDRTELADPDIEFKTFKGSEKLKEEEFSARMMQLLITYSCCLVWSVDNTVFSAE